MTDARQFLPCFGEQGETRPGSAASWLKEWQAIGGGVTVGSDRSLNAWRMLATNLTPRAEAQEAFAEGALLFDLQHTPGLADDVRVILGTTAGAMKRRGLKEMGIAA